MDLNEIKNRAKDLLADLTDNRPDRDERPAPGRADDAVDDSAVRTDRLEPQPGRAATDPHDAHPRDADLRDPEFREPDVREPDRREPAADLRAQRPAATLTDASLTARR